MTPRRQFSKVERIYLVLYQTRLKFFSRNLPASSGASSRLFFEIRSIHMFSGVSIVTGNTTDQKNELKQNGFQSETKTNRFSEHFCLTDGSNLHYVSFTKHLAFRLKKALS